MEIGYKKQNVTYYLLYCSFIIFCRNGRNFYGGYVVLEDNSAYAVKSIANIAGAKSAQVNTINTYDVINADTLVIVKNAVAKLEEVYA